MASEAASAASPPKDTDSVVETIFKNLLGHIADVLSIKFSELPYSSEDKFVAGLDKEVRCSGSRCLPSPFPPRSDQLRWFFTGRES